jgi:hypothetical protein
MRSFLLPLAAILGAVAFQATVPSDLSSGFQSSAIGLQLSFGGDASDGLEDGAKVNRNGQSYLATSPL